MLVNIPIVSLVYILTALVSVNTSPVPGNDLVPRIDNFGYEAGFKRDPNLHLERRQRGGGGNGGNGGRGGGARGGAAGGQAAGAANGGQRAGGQVAANGKAAGGQAAAGAAGGQAAANGGQRGNGNNRVAGVSDC